MLSCDDALELISAQLDGPLSEEEQARLEEHLSACPACRALSADLAVLHGELPQLAAQPPAGLKQEVMDKIRASKVTPFQSRKRQWRWRSLASLAAVAALVLVGAGVMDQWRTGGFRGSETGAGSAVVEQTSPAGGGEQEITREIAPQPTARTSEENDGQKGATTGDSPVQETGGGQDSRSVAGSGRTETPEPAQASPAPTGSGIEPYSVAPDNRVVEPAQVGVNPAMAAAGLTQAQAVEKLALYLGWPADSLTADSSGVLTGPGDDGVERTITCVGLNEAGTGWVCQVEEIQQGPDGTASCASYTVPLDGGDITQP